MRRSHLGITVLLLGTLFGLIACGGGKTSNNITPPPQASQTGTVYTILSDDSTADWATIGVKVLSVSLTPQGGGTPVTVYTAPTPAPVINLVHLDQLGEILGKAQVPPGTYTAATLTIAGNPGDVLLTAATDPEPGFAGTPGAAVPSSQIQIQGTTGSPGSLTVAVNVKLVSPLVVNAGEGNAVDLEFNLSHPAFIVDHVPPGGGATFWAVSFNGPVCHRPIKDITRLVLRQLYGTVTAVASDNSSITITKIFPAKPAISPETATASSQSLQILADTTNKTLFYDLDAKSQRAITDFSSVASSLTNKYVRVAARYQVDGTLVAVRIWASSSFQAVWVSPEGHVLHVNPTTNIITLESEDGAGIPIKVDAATQFFFRTPANGKADATPIATGTGFLAGNNLVRGFKVHTSVVDPLAVPMVAQTVDIEIAKYDGYISGSNQTGFVYTRTFDKTPSSDDYTITLNYISSTTPNGKDANGNPVLGFEWWNFAFPTLANTGANAIPSFVSATSGAVNFGGTVGALKTWGGSFATWGDTANPNGWSARWAILQPTPVPLGVVSSPWASGSNGGSFGLSVTGGTNPVSVTVSTTLGSATLVYQVDKTNNIVTVSPQDITTAAGLSNVSRFLVNGTPVKVFGVPQSDGTIKANVVFYYTGSAPK
jgi:hypothetical protein